MIGVAGNNVEQFSALWATKWKKCHNTERYKYFGEPICTFKGTLINDTFYYWYAMPWRICFANRSIPRHFFFLQTKETNFLIWVTQRLLRNLGKACSQWIRYPDGADRCKVSRNCLFKADLRTKKEHLWSKNSLKRFLLHFTVIIKRFWIASFHCYLWTFFYQCTYNC
jgi:hypothetical protein